MHACMLRSVNFVEPADGKWGSRLSFSRWTGMVEQVRTGSVRGRMQYFSLLLVVYSTKNRL